MVDVCVRRKGHYMSKRAAIATPGKQRLCVGLPMFFWDRAQDTLVLFPHTSHNIIISKSDSRVNVTGELANENVCYPLVTFHTKEFISNNTWVKTCIDDLVCIIIFLISTHKSNIQAYTHSYFTVRNSAVKGTLHQRYI